ncbi:MAG: YitT family protein [Ruminococcaceae bacterium]|nr:YitT family protein [Oscillospiraceae bacterium]
MKNILKISETKKTIKQTIIDYIIIAIGAFIFSFGIAMFTSPNNIAPGGVSGIGTMLNHLFNIPIGSVIIAVNIPLFIFSFKKFGRSFFKKSLFATFLTSSLIDILPFILEKHYIYSPLLASIFGGVSIGVGVGIIFLRGGTTGGADILAKLIRLKYPHFSLGTLVFIIDAIIVISTLFVYGSIEALLYSTVSFFVTSRAVDAIIFGAARSKMLLIITTQPQQIAKRIMNDIQHGVTLIPASGAYTNEEKTILLSVVRPNEVAEINKIVKEIDRSAFTVITESNEVFGYGFQNS